MRIDCSMRRPFAEAHSLGEGKIRPADDALGVGASLLANLVWCEDERFASKLAPTGIGDPSGFATMG
jgi:hypothetical protein